ncbi:MMS19 nucleotide excision repair protein homolog isoform X2 [Actinia tenebrosa]|uniref:MMS19 nucleotide excision repair protein n=1 Tax=Actinia tenebrosa TaxID=6105 RepID=A0A6P8HEX5_ACTTE|nr:MMS19 nucleotide excision repair protein homolog isoform X2 [Actinia tenebrosa]
MGIVLQECNEYLSSLDLRMMKPNGRILQSTALAAEPAYQQVLQSSLPLLVDKYNSQPMGIAKKITLDVILELLKVAKTFYHMTQDSALVTHKDALVTLLFEALTSESHALCCAGITGLVVLVTLKGMITDNQVIILVEHLTKQALNSKDMIVRQESTTALAYLSSKFPAVIKAKLLPAVQSYLKTECVAMEQEKDGNTEYSSGCHGYAMETLSTVCTEESVVRDIIPVILQHGKNLAEINDVSDAMKSKGLRTYKCLLSVVQGTIKHNVVQPEYYSELVIPDLLHLSIKPVLQGRETNLMLESDILEIFSSIFRTIVCQMQSESTEKCLQSIVELFLDGKLPNSLNNYKVDSFLPLEVESPWQQTQLVSLLMPCLCAVKRDVCISQFSILMQKLQTLACRSNHKRTNIAAAKCLAGLINKMKEGEELDLLMQNLMSTIWSCISNEECQENHWSSLITWIWVTRALVLRSLPVSQEFVKKIISIFSNDSVGKVAADGFYILIADSDDVMTSQMHADIKLMYKQRFFLQTLPQLLNGFQSSLPGHKHHYLSALSHLLQWIPKQVLMSEVPNLMPLLIQSLSQDQASLLLSTLQTLYSLIFDASEAIIRQVTSLVPNFLRLVKFESSMKVRIEAIKCLGAMTTLPHHVVYVYKSKVIKSLSSSLDDHKRFVRAAAVTCRNEWFLLGAS